MFWITFLVPKSIQFFKKWKKKFCITDFKNRDFAEINVATATLNAGLGVTWDDDKWVKRNGTEEAEVFLLRPQMTCLMVSIFFRGER